MSATVGPGTGRRGPFDSCPQRAAATSRRAQSLPPERRGEGWGDWDEEDWNENEEEEEERDSEEEDDEEGEGPPRTAQRSPPGGAHQAMTQKAEVTAPIRLISPTTLELNQMAEAREVESANHRQLVSRTRETLKNLTSLDSLHSHRHNCGALGVCSISPTSKAFPTPRKTRYSSTC